MVTFSIRRVFLAMSSGTAKVGGKNYSLRHILNLDPILDLNGEAGESYRIESVKSF